MRKMLRRNKNKRRQKVRRLLRIMLMGSKLLLLILKQIINKIRRKMESRRTIKKVEVRTRDKIKRKKLI